jgi:hypothetical protein
MQTERKYNTNRVSELSELTGKQLQIDSKPGDTGRLYRLVEIVNEHGGQRHYTDSMKADAFTRMLSAAVIIARDVKEQTA